jgi:hypothetical protein
MKAKFQKVFIIFLVGLFLGLFITNTQAAGLPRPLPNPNPQPLPKPPPEPPGQDPVMYSLGLGELNRYQEGRFVFYPRYDLNRITLISLTGLRNKILINEIQIQYADGSEIISEKYSEFYSKSDPTLSLLGLLRPNQVKQIYLEGRSVVSISVRASAWSYWENPGAFQVDVNAND